MISALSAGALEVMMAMLASMMDQVAGATLSYEKSAEC